ncbi:hypothetical protein J1G42_02420 [Cellulomonas sp. zg-ZUI222]|uniref:Uncharacterized protein n=1 Tax=Cellulomonas wangleii TaxID=2816956 RepID=A0ABX8D407_9CELL|nr:MULTISPECIES: hypothetical protein [Cellulomonas]MBO0898816.1 hypothetical protein [Cellulomonas sp. zg-ZUI22]MBO0919678.1 hypothetical protein [Cellulomonas wangleii]MBO0923895.1 hypothetical protein [Cellulomonas wangleii]MBO0924177.1 hypothetical protein [Cellulomonas wangleii]QVI62197.1 hypothetical protein KG103_17585 [Cellulomonas wangleii]
MSTTVIESALADVRAHLTSAQVVVALTGAVTWTGTAADAAEARRTAVLTGVRACLAALDDVDRLLAAVRRAEQQCAPLPPLVTGGVGRGVVPSWG